MPSSSVYKSRGHNVARLAKKMHRFLKDGKVVIVDTNITSVVHVKVERTTRNGLESSAGHFDWPHPSIETTRLDECYTVDMSIGGQKVRLQLDTGSSDTWLRSSQCVAGTHKHIGHRTCYDALHSKTYQSLNNEPQFAITYEDDSQLTGKFISESIVNKDIHITNQVIGLVDNVSHILLNDTTDGILALGWDHDQRLARKHSNTFVENLQPNKIFMIKLVEHHQQAECTFGYVPKAILSRVKYTDVVHQHDGLWMVSSERTVINDVIIPRIEGNNAVIDTGSPLCRLESSICRVIYANIEGAEYVKGEGWIFPKDAVIPSIKIAIGDHLFAIHKSDLSFCAASKEGYVYGGIQSRGELVFDLLGDTFLKGIFAVFDVENKRFGAVAREDGDESLGSGSKKRRRQDGENGDEE